MTQFLLCIAFSVSGPSFGAETPSVLIVSTPTLNDSTFPKALERHKKSKEELVAGLADSKPDERVGCALLLWTKFPTERDKVLSVMKNDLDLDVRRRIATQLASKDKLPEAIDLLEEHFTGKFNLELEGSADLYLNLAMKLTALSGRSRGTDGALTILSAPKDWFADAAIRYPKAAEIRKDGLRTLAASFLSSRPEMHGNPKLRMALKNYCSDVAANIRSSTDKDRTRWEARLVTLLDIGQRAGFPELAQEFAASAKDFKSDYDRQRFEKLLSKTKQ